MSSFEVIPAIDLVGGRVVRLERGELERKHVYADDPVAMAEDWVAAGAPRLHVVDLDRSIRGDEAQAPVLRRLLRAVDVPVQVGGGIRDVPTAAAWLDAGADRVVVGAHAVLADRGFLDEAVSSWGERMVVALDAKGREIRTGGWLGGSGVDLLDAARGLAEAGVGRFLCTDIARDGMLTGPNLELLANVAETAGVPVLASGGVAAADDVRALVALAPRGVEGVIVGRALYEGSLSLEDAMGVVG